MPGGFLDPDVEAIIGYEPELVIGLYQSHEGLAAALEGSASLWIIESPSIEDSIQYLRDLGTLTGRQEQAAEAEQRFREKLAGAERQARKDLTALVVFGYPDGSFQIATGSYLGEVLERLFDYPWEQRGEVIGVSPYSVEEIVATDADVLFVMTYTSDPSDPGFSEVLVDDPLWGQLTAVRNGAVHEVSSDLWGNGRGTRSLGEVATEARELVNADGSVG